MRKNFLSVCMAIVLCAAAVFSVACAKPAAPSAEGLSQTSYPLSNLSEEFTVADTRLTTYYKSDSELPYVGAVEFLSTLDGVFDVSGLNGTVYNDGEK